MGYIINDTFNRADTSIGSGANSTNVTGPTVFNSPSTGAPYIDEAGNVWFINGDTLQQTNINNSTFGNIKLYRPSSENIQDVLATMICTPTLDGNAGMLLTRVNTSTGKAYAAMVFGTTVNNFTLYVATIGPGVSDLSFLASAPFTESFTGTEDIVVTLQTTGINPTTIIATAARASSPTTYLAQTELTDSTSDLQISGSAGMSGNTGLSNVPSSIFKAFSTQTISSPLTMGTLAIANSNTGPTLSITSGLSGGSGSGYQYSIYRGTTPNFTADSGSLLATVSSMPYQDTTGTIGQLYFYGIIGNDDSGNTVNAQITGQGMTSFLSYIPGIKNSFPDINLIFIGDSITYSAGANGGTVLLPTAPYSCILNLKRLLQNANIHGVNLGISGTTTTDWAPGGSPYNGAISNANSLHSSYPTAQTVFHIMLGTNDSASTVTNNSPYTGSLTPSEYQTKYTAIITSLLSDFPSAIICLNFSTYYTPNTHNGAVYEQAGLAALYSYYPAFEAMVASFATSNPGKVFAGDLTEFNYFAQNYLTDSKPETSADGGNFYLHPNDQGCDALGAFWANTVAIAINPALAPGGGGGGGGGSSVHNIGTSVGIN